MSDDEAPVPKIPYTSGFKISGPQLVRIALTLALLVMLLVAREPCSNSVSKFVTEFGSGSGSTSPSVEMPRPGNVDKPPAQAGSGSDYEVLN